MAPRIDGTAPLPAYDNWANSSTAETVRPREGETLEKIAQRLDVDPDALAEANPQVKNRQQVLTPFHEIRLPQELTAQKPAQAVPISQPSKHDQPPPPMGDTVANSAFKANLYAAPMAAPGGAKREQWLAELARDPAEAHRAWKNLGGLEKAAVLAKMEKNYGKDFAQQFFQEAKKGKPQFGTDNFQPGTGPTADQLKARGFRLGWTALGNGGVEVEHWVHPSGKAIDRDVSTWKPGGTQELPAKSPVSTKGPEKIDQVEPPTPDTPLDKAWRLLGRMQEMNNDLQGLLEQKPVPWDKFNVKIAEFQILEKNLDKVINPENPDSIPDGINEDFYNQLQSAKEDFQQNYEEADKRNPDWRQGSVALPPDFEED